MDRFRSELHISKYEATFEFGTTSKLISYSYINIFVYFLLQIYMYNYIVYLLVLHF